MSQWGFYFDQTRCVGCKACVLACKAWNEDKRGDASLYPRLSWIRTNKYAEPDEYENLPGAEGGQNFAEYSKYHMKENWRRVYTTEYGTQPPDVDVLHLSVSCHHCDDAACIAACPMKRIYKEDTMGLVLIDQTKACISCKKCKIACPWDAPQFYDDYVEAHNKALMTKCTLCYERISSGLKPACVAACPLRALDAGPLEELKKKYPDASEEVENFYVKPGAAANVKHKPNILFKKKKPEVQDE